MKRVMDRIEVSLGDYPPINDPFTAMVAEDRQALLDFCNACKNKDSYFEITMPCGLSQVFREHDDIPMDDLPCPCGREGHYLIRYKKE